MSKNNFHFGIFYAPWFRTLILGLFFVLILLLAFFVVTLHASPEARVLPAYTTIFAPDSEPLTITENYFLLDRTSMEKATLALEKNRINEEAIAKLKKLSDDQQAALNVVLPWSAAAAGLALLAGFLAGNSAK